MMPSIGYALRVLRRDPGFTLVAIASLALGIGATAAMFSFADEMILRPLPVPDPDRVVTINTEKSAQFAKNTSVSYPDYVDLRDRNRSFEGLAAASFWRFGFSPDANTLPHMKLGMFVSGNFFQTLGVQPAMGRAVRPDEDQAEGRDAVVVLGHDFWVSQFNSSSAVLGSKIRLDGIEFTVIGVTPEHFTGIDTVFRPTLYVPFAMSPRMMPKNLLHDRDTGWLFVKGRLKPGATLDQARADIAALASGLEKLHKQVDPDQRLKVETEWELRVAQGPSVWPMTIMLNVLGIAVLLVACANVAGLLLSRARARTREIAVRLAIGAGRWALVRQLLLESLLIALGGGLGGAIVADVIADYWRRTPVPFDLPVVFDMSVNHRVLLFTLAVAVVSTLLFGLAPALRATRPDLVPALKAADADSAGKHRFWGRNVIVSGQVALSLVLLAIAAVMVQGFRYDMMQGPGFRVDHLFLTSFDTDLARYSSEQTQRFYDNLLERTRTAAGVRSAALTSAAPMAQGTDIAVVPEGMALKSTDQAFGSFGAYISDGYFRTMDIRILRGRDFSESDRENAPLVAIVNEHMARKYWPNGDALGKHLHLGKATGPMMEIVGIAHMSKYLWTSEPPLDYVYLPFRQHRQAQMSLVAESEAPDAGAIAPVVRGVVRGLDPDMPVFDVRTMRDFYEQRIVSTGNRITDTVTSLGLMGVVLAMVGLYGLVAYSVSRRTREIGIRMAIGADRRKVVWMVLGQGLKLGAAGIAVGLVLSFFACRLAMSALWFEPHEAVNPLVLAALPLLFLAVVALATWAPARRASLVDPMRSLRDE
jgi:predicted permease